MKNTCSNFCLVCFAISMSCSVCGLTDRCMKRCVQCKAVIYCSKSCQIKDWTVHKLKCTKKEKDSFLDKKNNMQSQNQPVKLFIKHNHEKHCVLIPQTLLNPKCILNIISEELLIPLDSLNLIAKGKVVNEDNVSDIVFRMKIRQFMAVGEAQESEKGMHIGDIDTIVEQLNVDRNKAIRGLKHCGGNLIDALLYVGDSL
uniref:ZF(MYND)-8 zinc finger protein n=1 Tax=Phallusia mammillata TaxID=59560 RepID=A0A6F9DUR9_9ASCI|nr:ZF(MYND)-8 zinc finger protein [Phallusia mammillata]